MKKLTEHHGHEDELKEAFLKVKEVSEKIFSNVKDNIENSSLSVSFPDTEIFFQFNADIKSDVYKSSVIYIDDGFKSLLSEKGSGIQSATIIGLFNYYVSNYCITTSALLCIEEPELYLHPHACRVISSRLDEFLDNNKNQVVLTTHSPEFIKSPDASLNIILVTKDKGKTKSFQLKLDDYKQILLDNNHNELFFADKVIICEGFDNYILSGSLKNFIQEN